MLFIVTQLACYSFIDLFRSKCEVNQGMVMREDFLKSFMYFMYPEISMQLPILGLREIDLMALHGSKCMRDSLEECT